MVKETFKRRRGSQPYSSENARSFQGGKDTNNGQKQYSAGAKRMLPNKAGYEREKIPLDEMPPGTEPRLLISPPMIKEETLASVNIEGHVDNYLLTKATSYAEWKETLYQELKEMKCLFTIDPTVKKKTNMTWDDELKYRKLTKAIICTRIDDDHLNLVGGEEDPLKVMKMLDDYRDKNSRYLQVRAQQRLDSMVYDNAISVKDFILMFENLIKEVEKYSGERISDTKMKQHLLAAIISDYPDIMVGSRKSADKVTYADLKKMLIDEVERRPDDNEEMSGQVKSDKRIQELLETNPRHALRDISCMKCGAYGHLIDDCKRKDARRKCYSCLKFVDDHMASTCPEKQDYSRFPKIIKERVNSKFQTNMSNESKVLLEPKLPALMGVPFLDDITDSSNMLDLPPVGRLRKVIHIRRKLTAKKLKTGRVPKSDLIFTDSDFYTDMEYREMFIEEDEQLPDDIVLESIQVMSTD